MSRLLTSDMQMLLVIIVPVAFAFGLQRRDCNGRCRAQPPRATTSSWEELEKELNELPAFVCCNSAGAPLTYEREGQEFGVFYTDVNGANEALRSAQTAYPELGLELVAIGLGDAVSRRKAGTAVIVPGANALRSAADPSGASWNAEDVPLFGCLQMTMPRPNGGAAAVPLFVDPKDAELAVANAKPPQRGPDDDPSGFDLTIVCIALDRAIELVVSGQVDNPGFMFVAPQSAMAYLSNPTPPRTSAPKTRGRRVTGIPGTNFGVIEDP